MKNVDLTHRILELVGKPTSLDQAGRRSAGPRSPLLARHAKLEALGLAAAGNVRRRGSRETVAWYRDNERWWRPIKDEDPEFRKYYQAQYRHTR